MGIMVVSMLGTILMGIGCIAGMEFKDCQLWQCKQAPAGVELVGVGLDRCVGRVFGRHCRAGHPTDDIYLN